MRQKLSVKFCGKKEERSNEHFLFNIAIATVAIAILNKNKSFIAVERDQK